MNTHLKPYSKYKDSDVEWLGKISAHWKRLPGRVCYRETKSPNTGLQIDTVLSLSFGKIVIKPPEKLHGLVPTSFETYQLIESNDIVIRPTDLQNDWNSLRFGLANTTGIITSAYICLRTSSVLTPQYGHLLLHTYDLKKIFYGLGSGLRQNLSWRDFKYLPCLVPPLLEQTAIVRYLDYLDRRIRRYIRARQKLIKLLKEQKQVVIHRAVTRGLDPDVPLKPSGVDWLGEVPEHWEVRRVKSLCLVKRGASPRPIADPKYFDDNGEYAWVRIADVTASQRYLERTTQRLSKFGQSLSVPLDPGSLFLSIAGSVGKPIITKVKCCIHDGFVYFPQFKGNTEFLLRVFESGAPFHGLGKLGTQLNLNTETVGAITLGWPPLPEQTAIVEYLDKTTADLDTAITRACRGIDLLQEYRTRLIADVVTGKLDVREAAAALPDESVPLSG